MYAELLGPEWQGTSAILGGCTAGVVGATVTHPFDTSKAWKQAGLNADLWKGCFRSSVSEVFAGYVPRTLRVISAVTVMSSTAEVLKSALCIRY